MRRLLLPLILLLILMLPLLYEAYWDAPTYDEPANMAASYDYFFRGDFRIYPDNPPFVKILAGLSLLPIASKINFPEKLPTYADPAVFNLYDFGRDFLYKSGNNARSIIFLTRLPNVFITIGLGLLLFYFSKALYGDKAGLLALFLYTIDPNVRGHGHVLAFDIPHAFVIMLALYLTYKWITQKSKIKNAKYLLSISLIFALGFLVKFTFVFFAGIYFGVMLMASGSHRKLLFIPFLVSISSFLILWLFGLFTNYHKMTLNYDQVPIIASANEVLKDNFAWNLFKKLPVPYYYKVGLQTMYTHNLVSQPAFLLGEVRAKNDWFFYFPATFLLKTPIPTLIFIAFTILILLKSLTKSKKAGGEKEGFAISCFPFLFALAFLLLMMFFSHINNVYRYLFPSLVLFILGASQIVNLLDFHKKMSNLYLLICLFAYLLITSSFSFPFDLSYTNELTGIPAKGYKYLSDSEIDWGQDLERLGKWLKKNNLDTQTITLSYLGTADPEYYRIKYKPLKFEDLESLSGLVAVSIGNLTLADWQWRSRPEYKLGTMAAPLDFLRAKKPETMIGKSIFLYKF